MKNSAVLEGNRNYELQLTSKENLIEISDMLKQRIEEHKRGCDDQWLTVTPEIKKDVEHLGGRRLWVQKQGWGEEDEESQGEKELVEPLGSEWVFIYWPVWVCPKKIRSSMASIQLHGLVLEIEEGIREEQIFCKIGLVRMT
ncbi:hypothetical protein L195_g007462 [Trifolium pratense]|uniref:Uncharacterized protein n=1 Tax=Trifolium pratense TaxID=57577 RepID=A0A2K3P6H9_TRIPR|nr:hypothetical protein L195_g005195 [Trifolium pratense]PNY10870.1 hypothetical protein L195_g007462 [Trifolium pratense]